MLNQCNSESNLNPNPNFQSRLIDKSEWYCRTVHCFQNIWFNKRTHLNENRNVYWLSTKCLLASDQPIKELLSASGLCARRDSALIRQLANWKLLLREATRRDTNRCLNSEQMILLGKPLRQILIPSSTPLHCSWCKMSSASMTPGNIAANSHRYIAADAR